MKQVLRLVFAGLFVSLAAATATSAQVPYKEGNVERVVLVRIVPGHFDAFMADIKKNVVPIWESEKTSGILVDYHMFLNTTHTGTDDWDIGYALVYKNMASLDGLADKVYDLRMKQYGDSSAEQKVLDKRYENGHLVSSMLLREITIR